MDILNKYERELERNSLKKKTIESYKRDLNKFYDYIKELLGEDVGFEESLSLIQYRELENFIGYLEKKKYAKSTINRTVMAVKSFYSYYSKYEDYNPAQKLRGFKKVESKRKKELTKDNVIKILNQINNNASKDKNYEFYCTRDRFLIGLLATTGLRIEEALTIKFKNIENYVGYKMVNINIHSNTTKLNKRVPICSKVLEWYELYLTEYRKKFDVKEDNYLIVSPRSGKKIEAKITNARIRRFAEANGIEGISNHCFRNFCNMALVIGGTPDIIRNKILGWNCSGDMGASVYFYNNEEFDKLMVQYCSKVLE